MRAPLLAALLALSGCTSDPCAWVGGTYQTIPPQTTTYSLSVFEDAGIQIGPSLPCAAACSVVRFDLSIDNCYFGPYSSEGRRGASATMAVLR